MSKKNILAKYISIFIGFLLFIFVILYLWAGAAVRTDIERIENTVNLNPHKEAMTVGDVWEVEDLFTVHLKEIAELSNKQVEEEYHIAPDDKSEYYRVCFDYENIEFPGYYVEREFKEKQLRMSISVYVFDADRTILSGSFTENLQPYYYADFSTKKINNTFLLGIKENVEKASIIEIEFKIQTENDLEVYKQQYQLFI